MFWGIHRRNTPDMAPPGLLVGVVPSQRLPTAASEGAMRGGAVGNYCQGWAGERLLSCEG
jgi:hypothetical protein